MSRRTKIYKTNENKTVHVREKKREYLHVDQREKHIFIWLLVYLPWYFQMKRKRLPPLILTRSSYPILLRLTHSECAPIRPLAYRIARCGSPTVSCDFENPMILINKEEERDGGRRCTGGGAGSLITRSVARSTDGPADLDIGRIYLEHPDT